MYAKNVANFLALIVSDGALSIDTEDEVVRESMVCQDGEVVHARVREALGIEGPVTDAAPTEEVAR
jgi:NAD(P) transhydrogenase subunit alpha